MFRDYRCVVLRDCVAEVIGNDLPRSNHEASLLLIEMRFRLGYRFRTIAEKSKSIGVSACREVPAPGTYRRARGSSWPTSSTEPSGRSVQSPRLRVAYGAVSEPPPGCRVEKIAAGEHASVSKNESTGGRRGRPGDPAVRRRVEYPRDRRR
jgi:hypothetical protein